MSRREEEKTVLGLLLVLLRSLKHWSQAEMSRASGIQKSQISLYELGVILPSEVTLRRLVAAAGLPWAAACKALPALQAWYRLITRPAGRRPALPRKVAAGVGRAAAGAFRDRVQSFLLARLPAFTSPEPPATVPQPPEPEVTGLLVTLLRSLRHWTKEELANASGVQRSQISAYGLGLARPRHGTMERLASAVGVPLDDALTALPFLRELVRAARGGAHSIDGLIAGVGQAAEDLCLLEVEPFLSDHLAQADAYEARRQAEPLLNDLLRRSPAERWRIVEEHGAYRTWALAERAAFASEKLAAHDADEAVDLARLAVRMAERLPDDEALRSRVGGLCWGFLANAFRVKGDFAAADEAFLRSDRLWQAGASAGPGLILDGTRLLDLKASLRRHLGRPGESLDLLEQALAASRSDEATSRLLLKKSATLEQMGDWQGAITALEQARPFVEKKGILRDRCVLEFNLCRCLSDADRYREAEALLPKVKGLALRLGNRLDTLRCRWLQALISAGLGRLEEAAAGLESVAGELAALGIAFDTARACLDLSGLYLRQGRTAEVKRLAGQMVEAFKAQNVHREALAAVILFQQAAEQETATAELVTKLSEYLRRAQHCRDLRFEP